MKGGRETSRGVPRSGGHQKINGSAVFRQSDTRKARTQYHAAQPIAIPLERISYKEIPEASLCKHENCEAQRPETALTGAGQGGGRGAALALATRGVTTVLFGRTALKLEAVAAELFDRRLRSNLSVYHVDYKALQFTTSGLLTGVASSALFGQAVVQSGNARANGFEWENTAVPIRGVTLGANFGYTDFKFDQATIFPGFLISSGAPGYLEFARPKWTINLSSQYDSPELFGGVHFMARIDGNFRSKQLLTSDVAIGSGLTVPETPGLRAASTAPASWLVNGRMGLSGFKIGGAKAEVAVWGKNIFDNDKIVQVSGYDLGPVGFIAPAIYERARTFGLDLTVQF
jgi:iron complex outermembrane receptor protein